MPFRQLTLKAEMLTSEAEALFTLSRYLLKVLHTSLISQCSEVNNIPDEYPQINENKFCRESVEADFDEAKSKTQWNIVNC